MRFKQLRAAAALAFALAAATLAASAALAEPYRIVGFGDSLMAGYQLAPGQSFPEQLQAALQARGHDVVIANAGVSGDTTSGGLTRLDWSVPDGTRNGHPRARRQRHAARPRPRAHPEEPRRDDRAAAGARHRRGARRHAGRAQHGASNTRRPSTRSSPTWRKNTASPSTRSSSTGWPPIPRCSLPTACTRTPRAWRAWWKACCR